MGAILLLQRMLPHASHHVIRTLCHVMPVPRGANSSLEAHIFRCLQISVRRLRSHLPPGTAHCSGRKRPHPVVHHHYHHGIDTPQEVLQDNGVHCLVQCHSKGGDDSKFLVDDSIASPRRDSSIHSKRSAHSQRNFGGFLLQPPRSIEYFCR